VETRCRIDPNDKPDMPSNLGEHAREYWSTTVEACVHLLRSDTPLAVECCRLYDLYRRSVVMCENIPLDDEAAQTATKYLDKWLILVRRLYLDPEGREKLNRQYYRPVPQEESPTVRFFGGAKTG
jgi:hypothetical protein